MVGRFRQVAAAVVLAAAILAPAAALVAAQGTEAGRPAHGLAMHGDLKYRPGFKHFGYVNPSAPKGGTARLWAQGGPHGYFGKRLHVVGIGCDGF